MLAYMYIYYEYGRTLARILGSLNATCVLKIPSLQQMPLFKVIARHHLANIKFQYSTSPFFSLGIKIEKKMLKEKRELKIMQIRCSFRLSTMAEEEK